MLTEISVVFGNSKQILDDFVGRSRNCEIINIHTNVTVLFVMNIIVLNIIVINSIVRSIIFLNNIVRIVLTIIVIIGSSSDLNSGLNGFRLIGWRFRWWSVVRFYFS